MRKFARLFSAVALTLAVIICFTSCGLVDYTRSLVQKDGGNVSTEVSDTGTVDEQIADTGSATDSAVVAPGTTVAADGTATTTDTSKKADTAAGNTNGGTGTTASGNKNNGNTTSTTTAVNKPVSDSEDITVEDIEEMPVKDIQDLLFATEDPNTAGKILEVAGFEYDEKQGIYYSQMNPLQRNFGFNLLYDAAAPMVGMVYDTKRIEFEYDNREWMIQIWKGQYGITSGAEIGLYNRDPSRNFQYDCADDEDLIEMQFDFYNMNEFVFSRGPEKHWWLTGFKVFHSGVPMLIDLDMTLKFTDNQMADAFYKSLKKNASVSLVDPMTYSRRGTTVNIKW